VRLRARSGAGAAWCPRAGGERNRGATSPPEACEFATSQASSELIVESAVQRFAVPFVKGLSLGIRRWFIRLERVVDDDEVRAAADQDPTMLSDPT
jgi:hypothetical protein